MNNNHIFKKQADKIIDDYGFDKYSPFYSGSYYLDLMVCPDLDLYLDKKYVPSISELTELYYNNDKTDELYLMKGRIAKHDKKSLNSSNHIQIRTNIISNKTKWKIDIWIIENDEITEKKAMMSNLLIKLDEISRNEIISIKNKLLKGNGFTPKYSSYYVYDCYLNKNIKRYDEIKKYLVKIGLEL